MTARTIPIGEVGIDPDLRIHVRPGHGDYEFIYRAGMEICWDKKARRLSHPKPRDWTPEQWFVQIITAVADEYGDHLVIDGGTQWHNVERDLRARLETSARERVRKYDRSLTSRP